MPVRLKLLDLRAFLIRTLAGNRTVIINANISRGGEVVVSEHEPIIMDSVFRYANIVYREWELIKESKEASREPKSIIRQ